VSVRGPLARLLFAFGLVVTGALVMAGGVALRGPGLVAVVLAGALAGCTAAGIARESPLRRGRSAVEPAVQAAAWTAGVLLLVVGLDAVAGGVVAALVVAAAVLGGGALLAARGRRRAGASPSSSPVTPSPARTPWLVPVSALSTSALGQEWLRTTAALAGRLEPGVRQSIVRRREETLDELERRDPEGFVRWLAAGPVPGSDPAGFVHGGPVADTDAA
jgi:hypothetical protein